LAIIKAIASSIQPALFSGLASNVDQQCANVTARKEPAR
jgi:hypothetical protein